MVTASDHTPVTGFLKPWTARLGSLDAATGTFTDRRDAHAHAATTARGFCGVMAPGQVYVGAPGMSTICTALSQHTNIEGKWGAKVWPHEREELLTSASVDCARFQRPGVEWHHGA